ncbi:MAG TPA: glycosyltransferase family 1 protein [Anaerolineae bacterium]|nr:glycosyltransferase family 1 protein [Anaerolineae bacterium]
MRIGIDVTSAVTQSAGIGRYTRELVRALFALGAPHRYTLFYATEKKVEQPIAPLPPGARLRRLPIHDKWLARVWHRFRLPIPVELATGRLDLFHSPDFTLPPVLPGARTLLTVHDLSFIRDPDSAVPSLRKFLDRAVRRSVARAGRVLADSQATKDDLVELFGVPAGKIDVLLSGVDARFRPIRDPSALAAVRAKYHLGNGRLILSVGTIQPRKNYVRLIQAFGRVAGRWGQIGSDLLGDVNLVIAGGKGWMFDDIFAEVTRLGLEGRVKFTGFVDESDLPALYSAATVFAYVSLYEGFGLPVLEAMACGAPIIGSSASSIPEVVGDAGLLVDPTDVDAIAAGLIGLLRDPSARDAYMRDGLRRASKFTWDAAARQLLSIYGEMAAR